MIIYVDVDSVLNNLTDEWMRRYSLHYEDCLTTDDLSEWSLLDTVKKECHKAIYLYLHDPSLFMFLQPEPYSKNVIKRLKDEGHLVYGLSACVVGSMDSKAAWVAHHYGIKMFAVEHKYLMRGDILIDDGIHNADGWEGRFLLFDRPWNRSNTTLERVMNWKEVEKKLVSNT
jgi:5'-nucleotidase